MMIKDAPFLYFPRGKEEFIFVPRNDLRKLNLDLGDIIIGRIFVGEQNLWYIREKLLEAAWGSGKHAHTWVELDAEKVPKNLRAIALLQGY